MVKSDSFDWIKIIDFGISYAWNKDDTTQHKEGTLFYCPPEMLLKNEQDWDYTTSPKSDIWSLGITLYRLVFNKMPFAGETKQEVIDRILKGKVKFPKTPVTSPEFRDLIWRILRLKREEWIEIEDMFYHPWLFESKLKHAT